LCCWCHSSSSASSCWRISPACSPATRYRAARGVSPAG
jgi:hypothetical protein